MTTPNTNKKTLVGISADAVRSVDVARGALPYASWHENAKYLSAASGEHYKLLATVAAAYRGGRFYDVGTYLGHSALALAHGWEELGNRVISYDIADCFASPEALTAERSIKAHAGIELRVRDALEDVEEIARSADVVLLDVTPHDGKQERVFVDALVRHGFKGLLLLDDIHLNEDMTALWQWIPAARKVDLTEVGHWSGTGVAAFDPEGTADVDF